MNRVVLLKSSIARGGGLEKYAQRTALAFADRGIPLTLLTSGPVPASLSHPLVHAVSQHTTSPFSVGRVRAFDAFCADILQAAPAQLVLGFDRCRFQTHLRLGSGVHAAFLAQRAQREGWIKRLSFSLNPLHRTLLDLERRAFTHPELRCLIAVSHKVRTELLNLYPVDAKKVEVIHNGVEWSQMQPDFDAWPQRRAERLSRFGLNPDHYHFLFVGHDFARKGLQLLVQALRILPVEQTHLSVVGADPNQKAYEALVRTLGLQKRVTFFGKVPSSIPFYQLADCLVLPSFYDPCANVVLEALAMGLFVISSKENGSCELIKEGLPIDSLSDLGCIVDALRKATAHPKTWQSSLRVRASVQSLDFPCVLDRLIDTVLRCAPS